MSQLSKHAFTLSVNEIYQHLFPGDLCYLIHEPTQTHFLADIGSAVDVIREDVLEERFPKAFATRQPIKQPLHGIGGEIYVTSLTYLPFAQESTRENGRMPFCLGSDVPLYIIGNEWLAECDTTVLKCIRLHPKEVPMFMFTEEPWTAVSLINSLQNLLKECSLSPDVPQEKCESLRCTLEEMRQVVNDFLTCPLETDLNNDVNTIIAKSQWYSIYQPYSGVLEDLKGNVSMSCRITGPRCGATCGLAVSSPTRTKTRVGE